MTGVDFAVKSPMRKVRYNGIEANLSHFGVTKPGTELQLTEDEYRTVVDNPDYESLEKREFETTSFPQQTTFFDLRTVDWRVASLGDKLGVRSRPDLENIAKAMNTIGGEIAITPFYHRAVVESICEFAYKEGWHLIN